MENKKLLLKIIVKSIISILFIIGLIRIIFI